LFLCWPFFATNFCQYFGKNFEFTAYSVGVEVNTWETPNESLQVGGSCTWR